MAKQQRTPDEKTHELLEQLIETVQDLFILQALNAGANLEPLRKHVGVGKERVTRVSKLRGKAD
jgi:hypothetical protein